MSQATARPRWYGPGEGKSGGYRTILALRSGARAVFLHGFAKSALSNIDARELRALKMLAAPFLNATDAQIEALIENGDLTEVGWERGEKRPGGPSLKLLSLVAKKGLSAIA